MTEMSYRSAGVDLELYEQAMQKLPALMKELTTGESWIYRWVRWFVSSGRHAAVVGSRSGLRNGRRRYKD